MIGARSAVRAVALAVAAGLLAAMTAGCASGSPAGGAAGSSQPPAPLTAWQQTLNQVRPDGTVSTSTALAAFALAIGPVPGARAASGPKAPGRAAAAPSSTTDQPAWRPTAPGPGPGPANPSSC
jgi:hypothetical protein